MITIDSGKFTIPDDERFVGFAGDSLINEKQIALLHHTDSGCTFTLCLRFDDGTVREIRLGQYTYSSDVLLTWSIRREHLYSSGIVTAQVRIDYPGGGTVHTTKDYFLVSSSLDSEPASDELVTETQLNAGLADLEIRVKSYTDAVAEGLADADDVYTKAEIDLMIGDAEALMAQI